MFIDFIIIMNTISFRRVLSIKPCYFTYFFIIFKKFNHRSFYPDFSSPRRLHISLPIRCPDNITDTSIILYVFSLLLSFAIYSLCSVLGDVIPERAIKLIFILPPFKYPLTSHSVLCLFLLNTLVYNRIYRQLNLFNRLFAALLLAFISAMSYLRLFFCILLLCARE